MTEPGAPPADHAPRLRSGLTFASAALLVAAVVTAFVLRNAFVAAHQTVGWVVACSVVALLVEPLVAFLDRFLPRFVSVILVLLALVALIGGVAVGIANDVSRSLDDLQAAAPDAAVELEQRYDWLAELGLRERVDDFVDTLDDRFRADAAAEIVGTVPTYLVTGILMLFLLAYGRQYADAFIAQFRDPRRRHAVRTVLTESADRGRRYLLAAIGNAIFNGVVVGLVAWALDLPAAASLGVAAGALTMLPLIGVLVGGLPALLLAFGLGGWDDGAIVLAVLIALQALEATVVRRTVDRRTVRAGPVIPLAVALLGFELYGLGGAIYGVAIAVFGLAASDSVGRLRGESPLQEEPATA